MEVDPMLAIQYLEDIKVHATKYADSEKLKMKSLKMKLLDCEGFADFARYILEKVPERVPVRWDERGNAIRWEGGYPENGVEVSALLSLQLAVSRNLTARVEALE